MQKQTVLVGVLALVLAVSAAAAVSFMGGPQPTDVEMVDVVVAKTNIVTGTFIKLDRVEELFEIRKYPKAMEPENAIHQVSEAVDKQITMSLVKGDPVLKSKLSESQGLLIPSGMRAVAIPSTNINTNGGGWLIPKCWVDVLLASNEAGGKAAAKTLLQRIQVLAVDHHLDAPKDGRIDIKDLKSVTLLVKPEQAEVLTYGQSRGTLQFSMRNSDDLEVKEEVEPEAPVPTVVGGNGTAEPPKTEDVAPPPQQPLVQQIRTLRGTQSGTVYVSTMPVPVPGAK